MSSPEQSSTLIELLLPFLLHSDDYKVGWCILLVVLFYCEGARLLRPAYGEYARPFLSYG